MIHSGNNPSQTANCQIKSGHIQLRRERNNQQSISRQHCNNKFDLLNNDLECYTCHNFGHKSINCRLRNYEPDSKSPIKNVNFWKKESNKCGLVLSTQRKMKPWCSCSNHHRVSKNGSTGMPCWSWQGRTGCCGQKRVNRNRNKL
jgi:hypothetical protein